MWVTAPSSLEPDHNLIQQLPTSQSLPIGTNGPHHILPCLDHHTLDLLRLLSIIGPPLGAPFSTVRPSSLLSTYAPHTVRLAPGTEQGPNQHLLSAEGINTLAPISSSNCFGRWQGIFSFFHSICLVLFWNINNQQKLYLFASTAIKRTTNCIA